MAKRLVTTKIIPADEWVASRPRPSNPTEAIKELLCVPACVMTMEQQREIKRTLNFLSRPAAPSNRNEEIRIAIRDLADLIAEGLSVGGKARAICIRIDAYKGNRWTVEKEMGRTPMGEIDKLMHRALILRGSKKWYTEEAIKNWLS